MLNPKALKNVTAQVSLSFLTRKCALNNSGHLTPLQKLQLFFPQRRIILGRHSHGEKINLYNKYRKMQ